MLLTFIEPKTPTKSQSQSPGRPGPLRERCQIWLPTGSSVSVRNAFCATSLFFYLKNVVSNRNVFPNSINHVLENFLPEF
jgi:hypothetical protein